MKIVIATLSSWDALYVDGVIKQEGQTLYACDLIIALEDNLPCTIESIDVKSVDERWWDEEDRDNYPDKIEDVVFEKEE